MYAACDGYEPTLLMITRLFAGSESAAQGRPRQAGGLADHDPSGLQLAVVGAVDGETRYPVFHANVAWLGYLLLFVVATDPFAGGFTVWHVIGTHVGAAPLH